MSTIISQEEALSLIFERHDREKAAFNRLTEPEKVRQQIHWHAQYAQDNWAFLRDCVYTLDQVDQLKPVKPFPSYFDYLRFLTAAWNNHRMLAIPKSRRMTASWCFISLYTHDTTFNSGRFNGFVSKKEDDAADLVGRAEFIYQNIPEWRIPKALLPKLKNGKMSKQPPVLEFEGTNSKIQGFPMGADQLRQFTLSGLLGDECAFWEQAQKFYSSSKPTLDGGGRMTLISSRSPGFFKKIVFDKLQAKDLNFAERPPAGITPKKPMEGIETWLNPENKFLVIDLHYTANPYKRSPEWRKRIKAELPKREYEMEYEKNWDTFDGKPVYEDFSRGLHVVPDIEFEPGLPLILGWDFGLTPACVISQQVGTQFRSIKEFIEEDGGIDKLSKKVWLWLVTNLPGWTADPEMILSFIDPAGFQRMQTDEKTCASFLQKNGFKKVYPGPVDFETRKGSVEYFLIGLNKGEPNYIVSETGCPTLITGFGGGYQYPEKAIEIEPTQARPLKNKYSHPHDGLQYGAYGARGKRREYGLEAPPPPSYAFQQRR